jgi:hypothetical protein
MIKKLIKDQLKNRGLHIQPIDEYEQQIELVKDVWLQQMGIETILDIGASDGGFARKARKAFPQAQIYSFEPLSNSYAKLTNHFANDSRFKSFNMVLSNKDGEMTFYQSSRSGSSSLLEMGNLHKESYPESAELTPLVVPATTLDALVAKGEVQMKGEVLMKLDVQGAEKMVLEGAPDSLKKTRVVFSEMSFTELYKGQTLANELVSMLDRYGFKLCGIENVSRNVKNGTFLQCDGYFLRSE